MSYNVILTCDVVRLMIITLVFARLSLSTKALMKSVEIMFRLQYNTTNLSGPSSSKICEKSICYA